MKLTQLTIKLIIIASVIIVLLYSSCANIGSITGGPKDSLPPIMLGSKPVEGTVDFKGKKIILYFNEYFELKEINNEFVSSPPFKENPKFTVKQRALHIKFQEDLQDSVTYNLKLGNAVVDLNENNVYKNLQFIFATKSSIDTFAVSGNLKNAFDLTVPENTFVNLFRQNIDSIPYKSQPNYMAKIDSSGNFTIDYIEKGTYKIFAVKDLNSNKIADDFEPHAFLDTLIVTKIEPLTTIDSLKAGTILHDKIDPYLTDSLTHDSVIITRTYIGKPANLQLYMFEEEKFMQKVVDFSRKQKSKVNINFELPIDSNFSIHPINFDLPYEEMIIETNINNDSLIWWIQDTTIMAKDSLEAIISYTTQDSLRNSIIKNDTLIFEYRKKKERVVNRRKKAKNDKTTKQKPKIYLKPTFIAKDNKVELESKLRVELPTPLRVNDTSKIKLFEIYDTLTVDTKKQEILKMIRLSKDELFFKFSRPIAKEFALLPVNFANTHWYSTNVSDSSRMYKIKITDPEVAQIDTLRVLAKYDNHFFFNRIQKLSDTLEIPLTSYRIISRKREKPNEIQLVFDRPVENNIVLTPDDFFADNNWYEIHKNSQKDSISIIITDKAVTDKDTLTFAAKCFNYIDLNGDSAFFEQTMRILYNEPKQFLSSAIMQKNDSIQMVFNIGVAPNPNITITNLPAAPTNWYKMSKNATGDTLIYHITNKTIAETDTLKLLIDYSNTNRKGIVSNKQDSILLINGKILNIRKKDQNKQKQNNKSAGKTNEDDNKEKVEIYIPITYTMYADTFKMRNYLITHPWKEDTKYKLSLDSMAFIDIYNLYNNNIEYKFSTRKNKYYTALVLNLQNIHAKKNNINKIDSLSLNNDSIAKKTPKKENENLTISNQLLDSIIGEGNIILQLLNKENAIIREFFIKKDREIVMDYLHPGEYKLRIIFDKNNNQTWDTGNYFNNTQPERVIMNGKLLLLKANFENKLTWDVGKSLIESCYAPKNKP